MPDVFDCDSRHPKYAPTPREPEVQIVKVYGMQCEIILTEEPDGWQAEHNGSTRWARSKTAALESMIEDLQIDLYNDEQL